MFLRVSGDFALTIISTLWCLPAFSLFTPRSASSARWRVVWDSVSRVTRF